MDKIREHFANLKTWRCSCGYDMPEPLTECVKCGASKIGSSFVLELENTTTDDLDIKSVAIENYKGQWFVSIVPEPPKRAVLAYIVEKDGKRTPAQIRRRTITQILRDLP